MGPKKIKFVSAPVIVSILTTLCIVWVKLWEYPAGLLILVVIVLLNAFLTAHLLLLLRLPVDIMVRRQQVLVKELQELKLRSRESAGVYCYDGTLMNISRSSNTVWRITVMPSNIVYEVCLGYPKVAVIVSYGSDANVLLPDGPAEATYATHDEVEKLTQMIKDRVRL